MEKMEEVWDKIYDLSKNSKNFRSNRLKQLVTITHSSVQPQDQEPFYEDQDDQSVFEGLLPDLSSHLSEFKSYVKWVDNVPVPQKGLVQYFDDLQDEIDLIKKQLEDYLDSIRYSINEPNLKFVHTKERYEI